MPQAVYVTGLNFRPVQDSKYAPNTWQSYNQQFERLQKSQQNSYFVNGYSKLRSYKHYRGKRNSNKKRHSHNPNHQVKTDNIRQYAKEIAILIHQSKQPN